MPRACLWCVEIPKNYQVHYEFPISSIESINYLLLSAVCEVSASVKFMPRKQIEFVRHKNIKQKLIKKLLQIYYVKRN